VPAPRHRRSTRQGAGHRRHPLSYG